MYKNILLWLVLGSVLASLFGQFNVSSESNDIVILSSFKMLSKEMFQA